MTVYKLYASSTASLDGAAALDIRKSGVITAIEMDFAIQGANALDEGAAWELSMSSSNGLTSNDTLSSIASVSGYQEFLTTGGGMVGNQMTLSGLAIPVNAGERLFIHTVVAGTVTANLCRAYVHVDDDRGGALRDRRP